MQPLVVACIVAVSVYLILRATIPKRDRVAKRIAANLWAINRAARRDRWDTIALFAPILARNVNRYAACNGASDEHLENYLAKMGFPGGLERWMPKPEPWVQKVLDAAGI